MVDALRLFATQSSLKSPTSYFPGQSNSNQILFREAFHWDVGEQGGCPRSAKTEPTQTATRTHTTFPEERNQRKEAAHAMEGRTPPSSPPPMQNLPKPPLV